MLRSAAGRLLAGRHGVAIDAGAGVRRGRRRTGRRVGLGLVEGVPDPVLHHVGEHREARIGRSQAELVGDIRIPVFTNPVLQRTEFLLHGRAVLDHDVLQTGAEIAVRDEPVRQRFDLQVADGKTVVTQVLRERLVEVLVPDGIASRRRLGDDENLADFSDIRRRNRIPVLQGERDIRRGDLHRHNTDHSHQMCLLHSFVPSVGWNGKSRRISWTAR